MLQLFKHYDTGAFSHNKTASLLIKRDGASGGILGRAQCGKRREAGNSDRTDAAFRTSCHHNLRISILNRTECLSDTIGTGGAGRNHINAFSLQSELYGNITGSHIADHHGHQKRIYPVGPFFQQLAVFPFHRLQGADSGSYGNAYAPGILFFHIQPCILQRFPGSRHCILAECLHSLSRLEIHIVLGIEAFYLCCQLTFIFRCIEFGNRAKAGFSFLHPCPEFLHRQADGRNRSHSCYYYSSAHICLSICRTNGL